MDIKIFKDYYNLSNVTFNRINKQYIKSYDDFDELKNIEDDVLVLLCTFNNIILSNCYKNGCLNEKCTLNKCFIEDYIKNKKTKKINPVRLPVNTYNNQSKMI